VTSPRRHALVIGALVMALSALMTIVKFR
jgi:hypothetical protein